MKNFILGILVTVALILVALGAWQYKNQSPQTTVSPTPSIAISPAVTNAPVISDEQLMRTALFTKNNWPEDPTIKVVVKTNDGKYASGSVNSTGGGGYFFAVKDNGQWKIVADGNGTIPCVNLVPYPDYPKTLIPECWDESTQKLVKR